MIEIMTEPNRHPRRSTPELSPTPQGPRGSAGLRAVAPRLWLVPALLWVAGCGLDSAPEGTGGAGAHVGDGSELQSVALGTTRASASEIGPDRDGDGWTDELDNCIDFPNPDQRDTDRDGYGSPTAGNCVKAGDGSNGPGSIAPQDCTAYDANRVAIGRGIRKWDGERWGNCVAERCYDGYRLSYGRCLANEGTCEIRDRSSKEPTVIASGTRQWQDGRWSSCRYTSCAPGYQLQDDFCMPSQRERACTLRDGTQKVGTGTETWSKTAGWGRCSATDCVAGYHFEYGLTGLCVKNTLTCTLGDYDADDRVVSLASGERDWVDGAWQPCRFDSCPKDWTRDGDSCVPTVKTRSCPIYELAKRTTPRGAGQRTWDSERWSGWSRCEVVDCHAGYHVQAGNHCEPNKRGCSARDEIDGQSTVVGSGQMEWKDGRWSRCVFTSCHDGYKLSNGYCAPAETERGCDVHGRDKSGRDQVVGHGKQKWSGTGWGSCQPESCVAGYHLEYGRYCRSDVRACRATDEFPDGTNVVVGEGSGRWNGTKWEPCVFTSCKDGWQLSQGNCSPPERERDCTVKQGTTEIGEGKRTWNGTRWGSCRASSCAEDYVLKYQRCYPRERACYAYVGAKRVGQGTQRWLTTYYGPCENLECEDGYLATKGRCVPVSGN